MAMLSYALVCYQLIYFVVMVKIIIVYHFIIIVKSQLRHLYRFAGYVKQCHAMFLFLEIESSHDQMLIGLVAVIF